MRELYAGALFFEVERTADVLHAWSELLPRLPEELTSWANVLHFPPLPELPEAIRGRSFTVVMAAFLGYRGRRARAAAAAARARPGDGHVRDAAAGRARRPGDGPARAAALPERARAGRRAAGGGDRRRRADRRPRLAARARAAAAHGRRARPPRAGRRRARDAPRRDLRVRPRRRPGGGGGAGRPVELDALSAAVAPRRVGDYPNFVETPRTRAASSTPRRGSACAR